MSALCLYVSGLIVATPCKTCHPLQGGGENLQGGGEKFQLASLAFCHPPDQNAEPASAGSTLLYDLELRGKWYSMMLVISNVLLFQKFKMASLNLIITICLLITIQVLL